MPKCFCPEELGGASSFVPCADYSDWNPTHEHFPKLGERFSDWRRNRSLPASKNEWLVSRSLTAFRVSAVPREA